MSNKVDLVENFREKIQCFLNKFKVYQRPENVSFQFSSNPTVYELETQLPELWLRSRSPIDKNLVYYSDQTLNLPLKLFPSQPFIIPMQTNFCSKEVFVSKIELESLFGKSPLDAKREDLSLGITSPKFNDQSKFERKIEHEMKDNKWFLSFPNRNFFGPYTGEEVYMFIKNELKNKETKKIDFMVADSESDYYFKPEAIYELFCEDLKLRSEDVDIEKKIEDVCQGMYGKNNQNLFVERNLSSNQNCFTKFDVAKLKSNFRNAVSINIKELNHQLSELKYEHNKENLYSGNFDQSSFNMIRANKTNETINFKKKSKKSNLGKRKSFDIYNGYVKEKLCDVKLKK